MPRKPAPPASPNRKASPPAAKTRAEAKPPAPTLSEKPAPKPRAKTAAAKPEPTKPVSATKAASAAKPARKPAPEPAAASRVEAPPPPPPPSSPDPLFVLPPEQRQAMEALSLNLAKAALTAQGAITEAAFRPGAVNDISADPFHVGPALTEVTAKLAAEPERLMRAHAELFSGYMELWKTTTRRALGEEAPPVAEPGKGDKRFKDPDWSENPVFDMMKQSYLLTSNWLNKLVGEVEGVDPLTKRRAEFFTKMLTDAFSPSNFLVSNPVALREAMQTQGASLVKGAEKFAADLAKGGGQLVISQTDADKFKVGENVATAPGQVVFENALLQLLQFNPSTERVHEIPLLIFPPWINKYYILDLRPENSMIRWLSAQGYTVFVASWVNPEAALATKAIPDYMAEGISAAVDAVLKQCSVEKTNTVGYCIGGTLLATALAYMAVKGDERINSATFFAAQQDFAEAGDLLLFTNEDWLGDLEKRMDAAGGVLPSAAMADTFNMLRANDLIWSFFVNNYLLGKEPAAFDLLFWNSDQTRMPKALHMSYLRDYYKENRLAKGELSIDNVRLDLSKVKVPIYVQSSREDHIAPMRSVYRGARLFGGPVTFTLAGSGHIAGVINHPEAKKYQYWSNDALPATVEEWVSGAAEHPGSWWPHWDRWLSANSGREVPARDPTKGPLKAIEPAPGRYVKVKSIQDPA